MVELFASWSLFLLFLTFWAAVFSMLGYIMLGAFSGWSSIVRHTFRRRQFGLRTFLVGVLVISVVMALTRVFVIHERPLAGIILIGIMIFPVALGVVTLVEQLDQNGGGLFSSSRRNRAKCNEERFPHFDFLKE